MAHRGDVGTQRAAAEIVERRVGGVARHPRQFRQDPGQNSQSLGLADNSKPRRGGNEIGQLADHESFRRAGKRHAAARRRGGDGDRIGELLAVARGDAPQRLAVPAGPSRESERRALRGRFEPPLGRAGERDGGLLTASSAGQSAAAAARKASANNAASRCGPPKRARAASQSASEFGSVRRRPRTPIRVRANRRRRRPGRPATATAAAAPRARPRCQRLWS